MSRPKALALRLSSLIAATFFSYGFYLPFFPLWLQSKGLDPALIGLVVAIPIVVRIVVTVPLLGLADRSFGVRRLLVLSHLGQAFGFPLLLLANDSVTIIALVGLVSLSQAAIIPGNDLVATNAVQQYAGLHYGRLRAAGSVAFIIANIAGGYLVGAFGPVAVPVALTLIPILAIGATCLAIPPPLSDVPIAMPDLRKASAQLPTVLWILIVGAALTQGTHGALNAFASIYWLSRGIDDATIGYFWAAGVFAEIAVFLLLGRAVGRGSGIGLLLIGSAASVIRFSVMALHPGIAATVLLQTMHALSFGASHLGAMAALTALAPAGARGRAQGLYGSIAALTTAAATIVSGLIYREAGAGVFAAMAPLGILGFILVLVARRAIKNQPQSAG